MYCQPFSRLNLTELWSATTKSRNEETAQSQERTQREDVSWGGGLGKKDGNRKTESLQYIHVYVSAALKPQLLIMIMQIILIIIAVKTPILIYVTPLACHLHLSLREGSVCCSKENRDWRMSLRITHTYAHIHTPWTALTQLSSTSEQYLADLTGASYTSSTVTKYTHPLERICVWACIRVYEKENTIRDTHS